MSIIISPQDTVHIERHSDTYHHDVYVVRYFCLRFIRMHGEEHSYMTTGDTEEGTLLPNNRGSPDFSRKPNISRMMVYC